MLKAAKAQLYLRKVASACRLVKYSRAINRLLKSAASTVPSPSTTWTSKDLTAGSKGTGTSLNLPSTPATNTAQNVSRAASQAGGNNGNYRNGVPGVQSYPGPGEDESLPTPSVYGQTERPSTLNVSVPSLPLTLPPGYTQSAPTNEPTTGLTGPILWMGGDYYTEPYEDNPWMTPQDQRDLARAKAMTEDTGHRYPSVQPNFASSATPMEPEFPPLQRPQLPRDDGTLPTPASYGQSEPTRVQMPSIPMTAPRTQVAESAPATPMADTAYFDSLPMDQKVNWVAYTNATGQRDTYPKNVSDLNASENYRMIWGARPGLQSHYDNAREALKTGGELWPSHGQ